MLSPTEQFFEAITKDDISSIQKLLTHRPRECNMQSLTQSGSSPLMLAVQHNAKKTVEYFLEKAGANPDERDKLDRSPLHLASSLGHQEICLLLMGYGATVNSRDGYGNFPLLLAVKGHHFDTVNSLLLFGADVNHKRSNGNLVLHEVANDAKALEFMFTLPDNIRLHYNCKDLTNETPLLRCASTGSVDCMKLFFGMPGVDFFARNEQGRNVFHLAVLGDNLPVLQCLSKSTLLKNLPLINAKDLTRRGWTPMHYAVSRSSVECVKALLNGGGNINARDSDENTPLHIALEQATQGDRNFLLFLVKFGARRDLKNKNGVLSDSQAVDWDWDSRFVIDTASTSACIQSKRKSTVI
jgi:ankyrin repeat protein